MLLTSGLAREQWGTTLLTALDTIPQQEVYQRLHEQAGPNDLDLSWTNVTAVMKGLFGSRITAEERVCKLNDLVLLGPDREDLEALRRSVTDLARQLTSEVPPYQLLSPLDTRMTRDACIMQVEHYILPQ